MLSWNIMRVAPALAESVPSQIPWIVRLLIAATSLLILVLTVELIRREKLKEHYALLWLFSGAAIIVLASFPEIPFFLMRVTGIFYLTIIFFAAFLFLLLIVLQYSTVISQLFDQNRTLGQTLALLEERLRRLETTK